MKEYIDRFCDYLEDKGVIIKEDLKSEFISVIKSDAQRSENDKLSLIAYSLSSYSGYQIKEIWRRTRKREFVQLRQICMWFMAYYTKISYQAIGSFADSKFDHTTVIFARNKVEVLFETDRIYRNAFIELYEEMMNHIDWPPYGERHMQNIEDSYILNYLGVVTKHSVVNVR